MRTARLLPLILTVLLALAVPAFAQQGAPQDSRRGDAAEPVATQVGQPEQAHCGSGETIATPPAAEPVREQAGEPTQRQTATETQRCETEQAVSQVRLRVRSELRTGEYPEECPGDGDTSVVVLAGGQPAVACDAGASNGLTYAWQTGATWRTAPVETGIDVGSLEMRIMPRTSQPAIGYCDATNRKIKFALAFFRGDLNCDGLINFDDINPFVLALTDPAGYAIAYPNCNILNGDINGDGRVDFDDINPFVALLTGGP